MPSRRDRGPGHRNVQVATDDSPHASPRCTAVGSTPYHPSSAFRRLLNHPVLDRASPIAARRPTSPSPFRPGRAPALMTVISAAIVVGVVSGLLELAVLAVQVHGQRQVDWSTLMISRHVAWMLPAASALVIVSLTCVL